MKHLKSKNKSTNSLRNANSTTWYHNSSSAYAAAAAKPDAPSPASMDWEKSGKASSTCPPHTL